MATETKSGKKWKENRGTKVRRLMHGLNDAAQYRQRSFESVWTGDAQKIMKVSNPKKKKGRQDLLTNRTVWRSNVLTICSFTWNEMRVWNDAREAINP